MARAAIDLLGDQGRWQTASSLAIADARDRFSLEEVVEQYENFYARALEGALR
jgi:hypothetical protein